MQCNLRVDKDVKDYVLKTGLLVNFFYAFANHFYTLKIDLINLQSDGWLRNKYKELVIASYEFRISDLNKSPVDSDASITLPKRKFDSKQLGLIPNGQKFSRPPTLQLLVVDITRIDAVIVYNTNCDITEDRPYPEDWSMKEYNTALTAFTC